MRSRTRDVSPPSMATCAAVRVTNYRPPEVPKKKATGPRTNLRPEAMAAFSRDGGWWQWGLRLTHVYFALHLVILDV